MYLPYNYISTETHIYYLPALCHINKLTEEVYVRILG